MMEGKKSLILLGLLALSTLINALVFGRSFGTGFLLLLTGIVGLHLSLKWLDKKYANRWTKFLSRLYRGGLLALGLMSILILILVAIPQFSCQEIDEAKVSEADYLIVLGAGLKNGDQISYNLKQRLEKALVILEMNPKLTVIVSGGQGHDETISEAAAMSGYLIENGIDSSQIILEDQSRSTYQNLKFSREKLHELERSHTGVQRIEKGILITQDFHIFRSRFIAKSLGLKMTGICAPTPLHLKTNYMVREIPAVLNDLLGNVLK